MKALFTIVFLALAAHAHAESSRILVYQKGDEVPVRFVMEGDLAETKGDSPVYVTVKRTFFLKLTDEGSFISFDGIDYRPYERVMKNTLVVNAVGNDPAPVTILFNSSIK